MGEIEMSGIIKNTHGFSSSIDSLLFLVLVSTCAVLLTPVLVGSTQIMALHSTNAQDHNSQTLLLLMNSRLNEFNYAAGGAQMDFVVNKTLGPDAVDSGVYQTGKKLVAGRELKHKTFSDLACESVASQFTVYHGGRSVRLNLLTDEYKDHIDTQMKDHLDRQINGRYRYNVSVVWRPFMDVPIGGDTHMGPPVPDNAYVESTWVTIPYHTEFTRYQVESLIEDELNAIGLDLENARNVPRSETEEVISGHINSAINRTVDRAVEMIVTTTFEKTLEKTQTPFNQQIDNVLPGNNSGISDVVLNETQEELKSDPLFVENANQALSSQITGYLQELITNEIHEMTKDEVNALASDITDQYISKTASVEDVKDHVLDYVFSRIDISRARMTLALWD
jgi:hypothetical protein